MRIQSLFPIVGFAAVAAVGIGAASYSPSASMTQIVVIEHARTDVVTDTGAEGDTPAIFSPSLTKCKMRPIPKLSAPTTDTASEPSREAPGNVSGRSCLPKVKSPLKVLFYDSGPSTLAITGGTGLYANAGGTMDLACNNEEGTEFIFTYNVSLNPDS